MSRSFPEDSWVEVRYPLTREQEHADRDAWPWLPGWVVSVCGLDEWLSRPGARYRDCSRPVSPDLSPHPPCASQRNGRSAVPAVRLVQPPMGRGSWRRGSGTG
jgi:hypothetical protein